MKKGKRFVAVLICVLIVFTLASCAKSPEDTQRKFDEFLTQEFLDSVTSDYSALHVYIMHPENYGIDRKKVAVNLGFRPDEQSLKDNQEMTRKTLKKIKSFNRELLTQEQQEAYDIYLFSLEKGVLLNQEKYWYVPSYFGDTQGIHLSLPTYFADFPFYSEQDISDLAKLIADTRDFLGVYLDYTKLQKEKGTLSLNCDAVIEYCEGIINEGENSAVLKSILDRIDEFDLDDDVKATYQKQMTDAFHNSFLPAYQDVIDVMTQLREEGAALVPLAEIEGGKEYYELTMQYDVGTSESIQDIQKRIVDLMSESVEELSQLLMIDGIMEEELVTPYTDYAQIMAALEQFIQEDFPDLGKIEYRIDALPGALSVDSIAAYFNIPSLDGNEKKIIKVNGKKSAADISALEMYSTLAHEGLPGHMYQYAYASRGLSNQPLRYLISFSGYAEGYATYAQYLSWKYLDLDQNALAVQRDLEVLTNCIVVIADMGIHYDDWSLNDFTNYLSQYGMGASAQAIYEQLTGNPGVFLPYYVGYLQFYDLRRQTENSLGAQFEAREFHAILLEDGSVPFDYLKQKVARYIEAKQSVSQAKAA